VDRIKSTLSSDLDHLFAITIRALTDGKEDGSVMKVSDGDKARLTADMFDCLKTYDVLALWRDAEDVLRREVLREFVRKVSNACDTISRVLCLQYCRLYLREP
jgi:hypothetical protein